MLRDMLKHQSSRCADHFIEQSSKRSNHSYSELPTLTPGLLFSPNRMRVYRLPFMAPRRYQTPDWIGEDYEDAELKQAIEASLASNKPSNSLLPKINNAEANQPKNARKPKNRSKATDSRSTPERELHPRRNQSLKSTYTVPGKGSLADRPTGKRAPASKKGSDYEPNAVTARRLSDPGKLRPHHQPKASEKTSSLPDRKQLNGRHKASAPSKNLRDDKAAFKADPSISVKPKRRLAATPPLSDDDDDDFDDSVRGKNKPQWQLDDTKGVRSELLSNKLSDPRETIAGKFEINVLFLFCFVMVKVVSPTNQQLLTG